MGFSLGQKEKVGGRSREMGFLAQRKTTCEELNIELFSTFFNRGLGLVIRSIAALSLLQSIKFVFELKCLGILGYELSS